MPVDMFLKVDGIKGESTDSKHKDEIEVLWWNWGMTSSPALGGGGGAGAGRVSFRDLAIGKHIDAATAKLMLACASGQHISSAELTARQRGDRGIDYLKVKMDIVLVTSVGIGEPEAGGEVTETVTFNFREVRVEYLGQSATGAPNPPIAFAWDLTKNATG
jgi:type VI secretion system secreted protein Hcp